MKRIVWMMVCVMLISLCTGCGTRTGDNGSQGTLGAEGELTDIITQIYEKKDPGIEVVTAYVDLSNADIVKMYTGLDSADGIQEAVPSEAMMNSQAYSLVLVRVVDEDEAAEVAKAMREGIDQRKWVCVEADDMQVVGCKDLVMLFMVSSEYSDTVTSADMVEAFKEVCGGTLTVE